MVLVSADEDKAHLTLQVVFKGMEKLSVKFAGGVSQIVPVVRELTSILGDRCTVATSDIALEAARLAAAQA